MVELFKQNVRKNDRQSSKGNQLKWENEGIWYKADYIGYEGLAEYMVSHLLQHSTMKAGEFVLYQPEQIRYRSVVYTGVSSQDFLQKGWQIITLERLYKNVTGESLTEAVWSFPDVSKRFDFLVNQITRITGLSSFDLYLSRLLTIDALFINEDRHLHNIAVLMDQNGAFDYCPVFDNGGSLLSDIHMDYLMGEDIYSLLKEVKARTISSSFDEQLDVAEEKCGVTLKFDFHRKTVQGLLEGIPEYPEEYRKRVEEILYEQMRKYEYLF